MRSLEVAGILMIPLLICGMFGNLQLMIVTWRHKQLQHRNGILVAIIACMDFISELHEMKDAIEINSGLSLMRRETCFPTIFLYSYSFNMACVAILSLAIDRLLAVLSPVRYRTMQSKRYIYSTIIIGFIYSTPFVVLGFFLADDELVEPCNLPLAYTEPLMKAWNYPYVTIAFLIIILNIVSYFVMQSAVRKQDMSKASVSSFTCLLVIINYGSNYYVLFWRNRDYRSIFLNQLNLHNKKNVVGATQITDIRTKTYKSEKVANPHMYK
ncbi:unnamed protein product [Gongylonema pulchrum]|uniref:G_PROTEIN_RECEP_F1_2 domain-containing protein n=1 Tax=Gongylonema pulchrum TaxID=637853 RepID=A0A183DT82_9BILA|nr:unnamed protein product [Gongylonema pulchrum]